MTHNNFSQVASFLWSVADLLRGDFKQSQYGRIILPFTLLRRLECVIEENKSEVLAEYKNLKALNLPEDAHEKMLLQTFKMSFFNTSPMSLSTLGQDNIKANLVNYVQNFSKDAREIFAHFKFEEFVSDLAEANLLYKIVQIFASEDLSLQRISNHDMGLVFEELIRRFAESSNETAGEHFTPRDIVQLTTGLVFSNDDEALTKAGIIRTIYDPTAGTGGFLSSGMEYVHELNPDARTIAYGQELNPESYAICKGDMLIKGQNVSNIKLGNTLSNDQLVTEKFDYMLSNPPFGVDWKRIETEIKDEHTDKGWNGRFGAGLPRVSDGSLLFLLHLISKMHSEKEKVSRIGIILNGSPLFTGNAGSGESEIRRFVLESDLLEAIIALPTDMFYNTGIATYIWVLTNQKNPERKGKVQLINAGDLASKMRKSLGSKRHYLDDKAISAIIRAYGEMVEEERIVYEDTGISLSSKLFAPHEFGYRRVTIERPLRLSVDLSAEKIETLRYANRPFDVVMPQLYAEYGQAWNNENYGDLKAFETEIRTMLKADFPEIKEADVKKLLDSKLWNEQRIILEKAQQLAESIIAQSGEAAFNDFNQFDKQLKKAMKALDMKLTARERKQIVDAISEKNPEAERVIKRTVKEVANPLYGLWQYGGKVVEFEQDGDLRDFENIPLNPSISTTELVESYVKAEVLPHVPDAWINGDRKDEQDQEVGIVGYEIPFNRHFYVYTPPRDLAEIDAELFAVSQEIMKLLEEVHS